MNPADEQPTPGIEINRFVSVDLETAGPRPSRYSILSIGACLVYNPGRTFYAELKPDRLESTAEALAISGLSMEALAKEGLPPEEAMRRFKAWLDTELNGRKPVFVAFNAAFDWMFIDEYFDRYLSYNPFGHSALDIKAYFMGLKNVPWAQTGFGMVSRGRLHRNELTHNALQDAIDQAEIFRHLLAEAGRACRTETPTNPMPAKG